MLVLRVAVEDDWNDTSLEFMLMKLYIEITNDRADILPLCVLHTKYDLACC